MPDTTTLELVDAALGEGRPTATDTGDRELQLLALAIRDEVTPEPDTGFAREMDEWAEAGFQHRPKRSLGGALARMLRTPAGIAIGGTAVAALAIVAVLVADSSTTTHEPVTTGEALSEGALKSQDSAAGGAAAAPNVSPSRPLERRGAVPPGGQPQRIERQAELTLAAPEDEFQSVADEILAVADRRGGFVLRSSVSSGDNGAGGEFVLRVPADQLQAALRDLSGLADVKARSQSGQDVTQQYVTAHDGLQSARAERRSLLRRLAAANDDTTANNLRDKLDRNAQEIAGLRGQVRDALQRTNYATIDVQLQKKKSGSGSAVGGSGTDDALHDSFGLLVGSFNWLLRALGVLIPVGIVAGGGLWAGRMIRRRRREAILF